MLLLMLEMEEWLMLRDLHARGMNITQTSKETGYDRKTMRKHLNCTSIFYYPELWQRQFPHIIFTHLQKEKRNTANN